MFAPSSRPFSLSKKAAVGCCVGFLALFLSSACATEPLQAVFGVSRPPFVVDETQSGISVELFAEAMRRLGLEFQAVFAPNRRMQIELERGRADAVVEVQKTTDKAFYSQPFVTYSNVVLSHADEKLSFSDWPDLAGREVCAWQNAESNLGPAFAAARQRFAFYEEYGVQRDQVRLWLLGRCKVLIIDRTLVFWHMRELARRDPKLRLPNEREVAMAPVPGKSDIDWYVGFRDVALRDRFDAVFSEMRKDGAYRRILDKYLARPLR